MAPSFFQVSVDFLGDNRGVSRPRLFLLPLSMLALSGCGQDTPPARAPVDHAPAAGATRMEFRGRRPCVDCAGIEAWLQLEHGEGGARYTLVERYMGTGGERRFEERGHWGAEGDLLRLRSDEGGHRVYARMPDDSLHARASDGAPLAAAADDVLTPTTFDSTR